jgi:RNA polymerase sigma-70 factor (ECF subfamily)
MNSTPFSLLERLRRPEDHESWSRFVHLYTPLLYHWARRVGLSGEDAADLVQDVLALLVRKLPEFNYDPNKSFRAWLRTVTLNKWRERRRREGSADFEAAEVLDEVPAPDRLAEFEEAEYRTYLVQRALAALRPEFPEPTWRAFWEYAVAGRSADEVAAELGVRVGTVYAAKSRVLTRLRQELQGLID